MVKYCNAACQMAHRPQHKKECKMRAAELHDEELFKRPPQLEVGRMPHMFSTRTGTFIGEEISDMLWKNYLQRMYPCWCHGW